MRTAPHVAIVESLSDHAVREINALERRIVQSEDEADAMLWDQARRIVDLLDEGLSQRQLGAQWINLRTGEPYSQMHVSFTAKVYREKCTFQPRPFFRHAYSAIANASGKRPHVAQNSGNNEWFTPREIIETARRVLGGIDLDPASTPEANQIIQADRIYTAAVDGLQREWAGRVWLNPPYAQPAIERFVQKFVRHRRAADIEGLVLVNNATETSWFQTLAAVGDAFCFVSGRVRFRRPDDEEPGHPLQGQVIIYAGNDHEAFKREFDAVGVVLRR